jgi:hypothetical protein
MGWDKSPSVCRHVTTGRSAIDVGRVGFDFESRNRILLVYRLRRFGRHCSHEKIRSLTRKILSPVALAEH